MNKHSLFVAALGLFTAALPAWAQQPQEAQPAPAVAFAAATPSALPVPAAQAKPATAPAVTPPQPAPPPPPQPAALNQANSRRNVRFDITITDTGGPKPVTKTVSLTVSAGNNSNSVRNVARVPTAVAGTTPFGPRPDGSFGPGGFESFPLNVDVRSVSWIDETAVRASVSVEYQPYVPDARSQPGVITASASTVFVDGRRTQILQSSDPVSDRRTTIEVTATVVK